MQLCEATDNGGSVSSTGVSPQPAAYGHTSLAQRGAHGPFDPALKALFDDSSDGVLVLNAAGHRVYSNATLDDLIGSDACLPLGTPAPPGYVPVDQQEKFIRMLEGMSSLLAADGSGTASTWLELTTVARGRIRARLKISAFTSTGGGRFAVWLLKPESAVPHASAGAPSEGRGVPIVSEMGYQDPDPSSPAIAPGWAEALTKREEDVLLLLLDGRRVSSIARSLYLSEHTVRNHLKAIFRKLGAHSQTELLDRFRPVNRTQPSTR
jgi:DNA-binding CsgD family transcriptional regulator